MKWKDRITRFTENWFAKVMSFALALLLSQFYRGSLLKQETFMVPLAIQNQGALVPAENYPKKIKVSLWGDKNVIESIKEDEIAAFIDLSDVKSEGDYQLPIQVQVNGTVVTIDPFEATVEPDHVSLKLEKSMTKKVPIVLSLKGIPTDGYEVYETIIEPAMLEIDGPESVISKIDNLVTDPLLIDDRTTGFSGTVPLVIEDPLVTVRGTRQIQYSVKIHEVIAVKRIKKASIAVKNVSPAFTVTVEPPEGSVEIRGKKKIVESWKAPDDLLTVSADAITGPGIYILQVEPNLALEDDTAMKVMQYEPRSAKLTVELKPKPEEVKSVDRHEESHDTFRPDPYHDTDGEDSQGEDSEKERQQHL
ncbi:MAG: CdaR family protein [Treponema sp.]